MCTKTSSGIFWIACSRAKGAIRLFSLRIFFRVESSRQPKPPCTTLHRQEIDGRREEGLDKVRHLHLESMTVDELVFQGNAANKTHLLCVTSSSKAAIPSFLTSAKRLSNWSTPLMLRSSAACCWWIRVALESPGAFILGGLKSSS